MQADFVQHPAEIKKTSCFFRGTAESNSCHTENLRLFRPGSSECSMWFALCHPRVNRGTSHRVEHSVYPMRSHSFATLFCRLRMTVLALVEHQPLADAR